MSEKDTLIRVNWGEFHDLMFWLERCSDRGHLDNCYDLVAPWNNFQGYEVVEDRDHRQVPVLLKADANPV